MPAGLPKTNDVLQGIVRMMRTREIEGKQEKKSAEL